MKTVAKSMREPDRGDSRRLLILLIAFVLGVIVGVLGVLGLMFALAVGFV